MQPNISGFAAIAPVQTSSATTSMSSTRKGERAWTAVTTSSDGKAPTSFEGLMKGAGQEQSAERTASKVFGDASAMRQQKSVAKTQKAFEAVTLQVLVGSMLPSENNKSFGTGSAGKMWKSLFAEKLAEQITASGRIKLLPDAAFAAAMQQEKRPAQDVKALAEHSAKFAAVGSPQSWAATVVASPASGAWKLGD